MSEEFDTQVEGAVKRWIKSLWANMHMAVHAAIIVVPILIAAGAALAQVGDMGDRLSAAETVLIDHGKRIEGVETQLQPVLDMAPRLTRLEGKVDTTIELLIILVHTQEK